MEIIEDNKGLQELLGHYDLPSVSYSQIKVADDDETGKPIMANTVEIRPPHFSPSRKYPVVFFVYGGPISQTVTKQFGYDFQKVFSATADAVVVTVDGRGTGFMGRKFRAVVRDQLGHYEVRDQIAGATEWASRSYIDPTRIAIWGWSYGGYMTLKTLETDGGKTFSYGVAVAPVTDWRFYDSIYTERYMHTPQHNLDGYLNSAVTNATSLGHNKRFLVMHGTGDDNVHFQHTLTLLDKLDIAGVENYDVHVFPDSDHGIYYHNANSVVYDKISHWLQDAFDGQFEHKH
jgi:dipeptidyl aminopeptidase